MVRYRHGAREVREEDDARLQRRDEERLGSTVVPGDLVAELPDARMDLVGGEVDVADAGIARQANWSPYRWARRSTSRL